MRIIFLFVCLLLTACVAAPEPRVNPTRIAVAEAAAGRLDAFDIAGVRPGMSAIEAETALHQAGFSGGFTTRDPSRLEPGLVELSSAVWRGPDGLEVRLSRYTDASGVWRIEAAGLFEPAEPGRSHIDLAAERLGRYGPPNRIVYEYAPQAGEQLELIYESPAGPPLRPEALRCLNPEANPLSALAAPPPGCPQSPAARASLRHVWVEANVADRFTVVVNREGVATFLVRERLSYEAIAANETAREQALWRDAEAGEASAG